MRRVTAKPWFAKKKAALGMMPKTWQGSILTDLYIALVIVNTVRESVFGLWRVIESVVFLSLLFAALVYFTSDPDEQTNTD